MTPQRWTELFFLDEAAAFAAGHRPCGECRREEYRDFRRRFEKHHGVTAGVWNGAPAPWSDSGYGAHQQMPNHLEGDVLTPPSIVAVLRSGYRPRVHPTLPG